MGTGSDDGSLLVWKHPPLWTCSEPVGDLGADSRMAIIHVAHRDRGDYVRYVYRRMERLWNTSYPHSVDGRDRARVSDFCPRRLYSILTLIAKAVFKQIIDLSLDVSAHTLAVVLSEIMRYLLRHRSIRN